MPKILVPFLLSMLLIPTAFAKQGPTPPNDETLPNQVKKAVAPPEIKPLQGNRSNTSHIKSIDKYAWMSRMQKKLPGVLCHPKQYFTHCYEVNRDQCHKYTNIFLSACLDKGISKVPSELNADEQELWGQKMGLCTYELYSTIMADLKKDLPECVQVSSEPSKETDAKASDNSNKEEPEHE